MPASHLGWMAESISQASLWEQMFALLSILPGVPWPDRGVGRIQPFVHLQRGNNPSFPSPCSLQHCLCICFRFLPLESRVCVDKKRGATWKQGKFCCLSALLLLPVSCMLWVTSKNDWCDGDVKLLLLWGMYQGWSLKSLPTSHM